MFYTFSSAGADAQISADLAGLKHALPAGAVVSSQSWLAFEQGTAQLQSTNTPFVLAFAVLALVLAVGVTQVKIVGPHLLLRPAILDQYYLGFLPGHGGAAGSSAG